jgi:large subunit ribosomal protein L24e
MNCSFCGSAVEAGTGKMYIRRDATVFHFCSSKCQHNLVDLGRVNRHVRWTQAAEDHKGERVETHVPGEGAKARKAKANAGKATAAKAAEKAAKPVEAKASAKVPAKATAKAAE